MHRLPLSFAHTDLQRSLCCHSCVLGRPAVRPTRWRPCRATRPQDVREMLRESLATPPADTTDAYHEAAQFLREQGFNDTEEVNRILDIAMNPNSLHRSFRSRKRTGISVARLLSVEGDIQPVLNYLASIGLTKRQIIKVVSAHPPVLCYSPEQRLKPFFDILRNAGIPDPVKTMVQRPSMLGIEPDQGLRRIIGYLRESGQTPEAIAEMLASSI